MIPDGVNTALYLFRGKWSDAGFSALALLPLVGDAAAFGKYADQLNDVRRVADVSAPGGFTASELGEGIAASHWQHRHIRPFSRVDSMSTLSTEPMGWQEKQALMA